MKAPGEPARGPHAQPDSSAQVRLFEDYREIESSRRREEGLHAARVGDADGFEGAIEAIRDALTKYPIVTADDLNWPVRGPEVGSAFRFLAKSGEIECVGYEPSRRVKAHGRLLRAWRRA